MKHLWTENGKASGTKTMAFIAFSMIMVSYAAVVLKFLFTHDAELMDSISKFVTALSAFAVAVLMPVLTTYGARRWTEANAKPD